MTDLQERTSRFANAKAAVHRLLKFRPRSENEVRGKLREKGFSKDIISQTVGFFINSGMLDDEIFAKAWINSRLNKPMGLRRIKQELKEKGIADEIIAEQLKKVLSDYDESETIKEVIKRRTRTYDKLDPMKARRRMEGYLLRRGFSTETIYKTLNKKKDDDDR